MDELAWQLSEMLAYLESEEISHRDIKPRNIKFVNGRVYLLDFGIAYGVSGEMDTKLGLTQIYCFSKNSRPSRSASPPCPTSSRASTRHLRFG